MERVAAMKLILILIAAVSFMLCVAIYPWAKVDAASDKSPENHIVDITIMWEPDAYTKYNKWMRYTFDDGTVCYERPYNDRAWSCVKGGGGN